jgi:hypothetical protein
MTSYVPGSPALASSLDIIELRVISQLLQQDQGKSAQESLALVRNDIAQSLGYSTPVPGDT